MTPYPTAVLILVIVYGVPDGGSFGRLAVSLIGQNVVVMRGAKIGNNVKVQNNVSVYEGVELDDDVFCGPPLVFTNVLEPASHVPRRNEYRRTLVKRARRSARTRRSCAA